MIYGALIALEERKSVRQSRRIVAAAILFRRAARD